MQNGTYMTNMEIDPDRLDREDLKKMTKEERKLYFRKRKATRLARSKARDLKNQGIIRNIKEKPVTILVPVDEEDEYGRVKKKKKPKMKEIKASVARPGKIHKLLVR